MKTLIKVILIFALFSKLGFAQWIPNGLMQPVKSIVKTSTFTFVLYEGYGLYRSSDVGWGWNRCDGFNDTGATNLATNGTTRIYAINNHGVQISNNQGVNWSSYSGGIVPATREIWSLAAYGNSCLFGVTDSGVVRTTNGVNWVYKRPNKQYTSKLIFIGTKLFASTYYAGLFSTDMSVDSGTTWISTNSGLPSNQLGGYSVSYIVVSGTKLYASSYGRLFQSTNSGSNWDSIPLPGPTYREHMTSLLVVNNDNLLAGTDNGGMFKTTNGGINWSPYDNGLPSSRVGHMLYSPNQSNNYILVGVGNVTGGLYGALAFQIVTKVETISEVASDYSLSQNFPDPFNPSTTIKYQITKNETVSLKIFDILGHEVATLVNEKQSPGTYQVNWNAGNLSSGVYFYRLQTGNFTVTKRMILVK